MNRIRHFRNCSVWGRALVFVTLCVAGFACAMATPLTRLRDILDLPLAAFSTNPPVHVRAVVTGADKSYQMAFIQDASAGVFLFEQTPGLALTPGEEVEISGVAKRGLFAPYLDATRISLLGKTNLPPARKVSMADIVSGRLVGERVEVEGVVQRLHKVRDHLFLSLAAGENRCLVSVPVAKESDALNALDARVRMRGVVLVEFNKQQQFSGFQLFVNELSDIEITERREIGAFQSPLCPIGELSRYAGRQSGDYRIHVRGIVTLHWPGRATIIQDAAGAALIEKGVATAVKVGDEIEVAGFLAGVGAGNRLRNAEARVIGSAPEPSVMPVTLTEAETNENRLVRMMAQIVEWQPARDGDATIILSSSNELFSALLPEMRTQRIRESFPRGCIVSAVGVMRLSPPDTRSATRAALWLRSPADLVLLQPAPASPWKWVGLLAGTAVLLLLALTVAITGLTVRHQRTVARMAARQSDEEHRFEEIERQLRRSHRDRERIAQELHDNIIQSIYSVGLGIDEARRLAQKSPERLEERLNVAVQTLNGIIRDVRAFLVGLEPKGLEGHELKAALKSVLLASGEDQQARFSIQVDPGAARDLNSIQATEIFNIAKEAMSNSMRHAHARLTTVSIEPRGRGVRLEVTDDGKGFDPTCVNGDSLGLRNIRERARNIGARLEINSAPGKGTQIVVDIPLTHDNH